MGLESATYINQLDENNPTGTDNVSEGDDHIRLVKSAIKNTFPMATIGTGLMKANGASAAVTKASAADIVAEIGSTAVQNATNASNATTLTGNSTESIQSSALGSGTASSTTFLRGDRTWATLSALFSSVVSLSGASSVTTSDNGKLFVCTGTWTLSLPAIASVSTGFYFCVKNVGTGVITIQANGSNTIDSAAFFRVSENESVLLASDGSQWRVTLSSTYKIQLRSRLLTSGTTYTTPADVRAILVLVCGATGGFSTGPGGVGGGGFSQKFYPATAASYAYTIGAGGGYGTAGGTTTFDTMSVTSSGGVTGATGSAGGVASGGDYNFTGGTGGNASGAAGGGGGAGAGRYGSGKNGGTHSTGGGGGGTGTAASGGTPGTAATSLSVPALRAVDLNFSFAFEAGKSPRLVIDTYVGGDGAAGTETTSYITLYGAPGGAGGYNGSLMYGRPGFIQVVEFV